MDNSFIKKISVSHKRYTFSMLISSLLNNLTYYNLHKAPRQKITFVIPTRTLHFTAHMRNLVTL